MKYVEYDQKALEESIAFFQSDDYEQAKANKILAKVLEIAREFSNDKRQSDYNAIRQIVKLFPE